MNNFLNVLGISGSPRKGNSEYLLQHAFNGCRDAGVKPEKVISYSFRGKKIGPCLACNRCIEEGGACVIEDDFDSLRELWLSADVIIYSMPVYHMSMPGQVKCFIDRLGNSLFGKYKDLFPSGEETLPKFLKIIGSIAQGIHISSGQEHTITDLINHAIIMQSIPVTGDLWQSYIGCGGWTSNEIDRHALQQQYDDNSFDATVAVKSAYDIGRRAVEVCSIVHAGIIANKKALADDPAYKPLLDKIC